MEREQYLGRLLNQLSELAEEKGVYIKVPGKVDIEEQNYRSFDLSDCFHPDRSPIESATILQRLDEKLEELKDTEIFMVGLVGLTDGKEFKDLAEEDIRTLYYGGRPQPIGIVHSKKFTDKVIPPLQPDKLLASLLLATEFDGLAIAEYPHFKTKTVDHPDGQVIPPLRSTNTGWICAKSLFIMTKASLETLKQVSAKQAGIGNERLEKIEKALKEIESSK